MTSLSSYLPMLMDSWLITPVNIILKTMCTWMCVCVCVCVCVCHIHTAIVNKLTQAKYDVLWMSNGDIIMKKRELTSQLLNKVGTYTLCPTYITRYTYLIKHLSVNLNVHVHVHVRACVFTVTVHVHVHQTVSLCTFSRSWYTCGLCLLYMKVQ